MRIGVEKHVVGEHVVEQVKEFFDLGVFEYCFKLGGLGIVVGG